MGFWGFTCCCGGPATFTVRGCNSQLRSGSAVTVNLSGSPVGSGTTNGSGVYVFTANPSTTYTYSIVDPSGRFTTATGSFTTNSSGVANISVTLAVGASYVCCTSLTCVLPHPRTLNYTDSNGSRTATFNSLNNWTMRYDAPSQVVTAPGPTAPGPACSFAGGTTCVSFGFPCGGNASATWNGASLGGVNGPGNWPITCPTSSAGFCSNATPYLESASATMTGTRCAPGLSLSGTWPANGINGAQCPMAGAFTLYE